MEVEESGYENACAGETIVIESPKLNAVAQNEGWVFVLDLAVAIKNAYGDSPDSPPADTRQSYNQSVIPRLVHPPSGDFSP